MGGRATARIGEVVQGSAAGGCRSGHWGDLHVAMGDGDVRSFRTSLVTLGMQPRGKKGNRTTKNLSMRAPARTRVRDVNLSGLQLPFLPFSTGQRLLAALVGLMTATARRYC
jgi:hypothetical protein